MFYTLTASTVYFHLNQFLFSIIWDIFDVASTRSWQASAIDLEIFFTDHPFFFEELIMILFYIFVFSLKAKKAQKSKFLKGHNPSQSSH
jgi:hypothetical protein